MQRLPGGDTEVPSHPFLPTLLAIYTDFLFPSSYNKRNTIPDEQK